MEGEFLKECPPKAARRYTTRGSPRKADNQEWQEAKFQDRGSSQGFLVMFRSPVGFRQRDYYTSANTEGLQGVKDPATLRGPDQVNAIIIISGHWIPSQTVLFLSSPSITE
jgi:hypothetical protein